MDAATIYALLPPSQLAPWDMYVYLASSNGPLSPILIPKGENIGETRLVAGQPAKVTINYLSSIPWANRVSGLPIQIAFGSPVAALSVRVTPPQVSLFQTAEVIVNLEKAKDVTVTTDETRPVGVRVESGSGELEKTDLQIKGKSDHTSTQFVPTRPGTITLTAWSPNLPSNQTSVEVSPPTLILILCAAGGLLGGLLAYWDKRAERKRRILVGLVTGFVFYWALLFGVVQLPHFPHAFVLNPGSVVILSLLGGLGGTKAITWVLKKVGLDW